MPWTIQKRGNKYCVIKRGGKTEKCHDNKRQAETHMAALYASENKSLLWLEKDNNGLRQMLLVSSNNFEDREQEIVRKQALMDYVKSFSPNPLLFWHGGEPIGEIIDAQMVGGFLLELAKELPNKLVDLSRGSESSFRVQIAKIWDVIEANPGDWGASIGFQYIAGDEKDGIYDAIRKKETSILPIDAAANAFTHAHIIKEDSL